VRHDAAEFDFDDLALKPISALIVSCAENTPAEPTSPYPWPQTNQKIDFSFSRGHCRPKFGVDN